MNKQNIATAENFDVLLSWLDADREVAAQKYEKIRQRLIRVFVGRGCLDAEELADETFERVARKVSQIAPDYVGEPALYFYGVAEKIYLEWTRRQKKKLLTELPTTDENDDSDRREIEHDCLENCLAKLPSEHHRLIVEYYREEKTAKIENRRNLAQSHGITANALQVKASRIRVQLKECVRECVSERSG